MNPTPNYKSVFVLIENDLRVLDNSLLEYAIQLENPKQILFLYQYDFNKMVANGEPYLINSCNNRRLKFILECILEF